MIISKVEIKLGVKKIEGELIIPNETTNIPAVVICHPHPQYGGDMDNKIVNIISNAAQIHSLAVLKFNFRGVGKSTGMFDQGIGEQEDLGLALEFVTRQPMVDANKLLVAGYSFGGKVAQAVAVKYEPVKGVVLISPTLDSKGWDQFINYNNEKLVILGGDDTTNSYFGHKKRCDKEGKCIVVQEADHFWSGYEETLKMLLEKFFGNFIGRNPLRLFD